MQTGETKYAAGGDLLSVPAVRKDGRRISVQFSILPLKAEGGGFEGIAAIMESHFRYEERQLLAVLDTLTLDADPHDVLRPDSARAPSSSPSACAKATDGGACSIWGSCRSTRSQSSLVFFKYSAAGLMNR